MSYVPEHPILKEELDKLDLEPCHPEKRGAYKAAALRKVNAIRKVNNLEPLDDLPKGRRLKCTQCPLARSLHPIIEVGAISVGWYTASPVGDYQVRWTKKQVSNCYRLPMSLRRFRLLFDHGWYPELEI